MSKTKQEPGNRSLRSQQYGSMLSPQNSRRSVNRPRTPVTTENELESGAESAVNSSRGFFSSTDAIYTQSEVEGSPCSDEEHLTTGNYFDFFFVCLVNAENSDGNKPMFSFL